MFNNVRNIIKLSSGLRTSLLNSKIFNLQFYYSAVKMDFIRITGRPEDPNTLVEEWLAERQNSTNINLNPSSSHDIGHNFCRWQASFGSHSFAARLRTKCIKNIHLFGCGEGKGNCNIQALNNNGALVLQWTVHHPNGDGHIKKQVRVEGTLKRLSIEEETEYFDQEPVISQVRSVLVKSGAVVPDRDKLESDARQLFEKVSTGNHKIQKPENFGGFVLTPELMDFYVGFNNAIADRVCYYRKTSEDAATKNSTWYYQNLGV